MRDIQRGPAKAGPHLACAAAILLPLLAVCTDAVGTADRVHLDVVEATIPAMREAMASGRTTSRQLVEAHLLRIARCEEDVNALISVNHAALTEQLHNAGAIIMAKTILSVAIRARD